jgi:hypothetical protein
MNVRPARRVCAAFAGALLLIGAMSTAALADKRDFTLNNNSDYVLAHAYVSPSSEPNWGDDILGKDVLNPGESWDVSFDRGDAETCVWDVKAVTKEGYAVTFPQVDLCRISYVNVNN